MNTHVPTTMNSSMNSSGRRGVGGQQTTSTSVRRSSRLSNGGSDVEQDNNVAVASAPASKAPASRSTASSAAATAKAKAHNIPPDLFSPSATSRAPKKGKGRMRPTNKRKTSVAAATQAAAATVQHQPGTIASAAAPSPRKRTSKRRKQSTSSDVSNSAASAASAATEKRRTTSHRQPPAPPQKQHQQPQQQSNSVTPSPIGGPIGLGGVPPSASAVTDGMGGMRTPSSTGSDHFPIEGAAVKEALRVESEHGDAAAGYASSDLMTPTGSRTVEDVSIYADKERQQAENSSNQEDTHHSHHQYCPPPEGVVDLDLLAIQHMHVRANPPPYHPAEPYCLDTSTAYLAQYGRDYYRNLSDASTRHQRALATLHRRGQAPLNMMSVYGGSGDHSNDSHSSTASSGSVRLPHQSEISVVMRGILVDWLAELKHSFKLADNTLHLSMKLLDRVLCHWDLEKKMFQCLGCACMLIASKLEETQPVTIKDLAYMTDGTYTAGQIKDMEAKICKLLEFRLQTPTPYQFIDRYLRASDATAGRATPSPRNPVLEQMVNYLLELSLLDVRFVETPVCLMTAAAVYLARATLGIRDLDGQIWTKTLEYYTGYRLREVEPVVLILHSVQRDAREGKLQCIVDPYKRKERYCVAAKPALQLCDLGFGRLY